MQYKIIVDKQPSSNPSAEKKEYTIDIEEQRVKGDVYDCVNLYKDKTYVTRRLSLSEYGVLSVLDEPVIEELADVDIKLFEGDNYIYLMDMQGNKFYAEYLIKNDFNDIYATKNEMNSAITQTAESIELSVNQKLTSYATNEDLEEQVTELNSTITQTAEEINLEVSKKVGEDEVCSVISQSAEEISLKGNRVIIESTNFELDKDGSVSCKNININGGKILLEDDNTSSSYSLFKVSNTDGNKYVSVKPFEINIINENDNNSLKTQITNNASKINLDHKSGSNISLQITDDGASISVNGNTGHSYMFEDEIRSPKLTQTSLESIKKNISKFNKNATDIINNSDVYEYNLKSDEDTDKKLIGFIIGDGYRTPEEVISKDGQSVEIYCTIGILYKAVQELSTRVKQLEQEVQHE